MVLSDQRGTCPRDSRPAPWHFLENYRRQTCRHISPRGLPCLMKFNAKTASIPTCRYRHRRTLDCDRTSLAVRSEPTGEEGGRGRRGRVDSHHRHRRGEGYGRVLAAFSRTKPCFGICHVFEGTQQADTIAVQTQMGVRNRAICAERRCLCTMYWSVGKCGRPLIRKRCIHGLRAGQRLT